MVANATETFDTLMALKKVIQCSAMVIPAITRINNVFKETFNENLFIPMYIRMQIVAKNIRCHTSGMASILINLPKTAVKPQIKTMR
jgi:hypothetical protein